MCLTKISILQEDNYSVRILFGEPKAVKANSLLFEPGKILGLSIWRGGVYGTTRWEVFVLHTVRPGQKAALVESVAPGAEILLYTYGKHRSKKAVQWIDALRETNHDLSKLSPEFFKAADHRFRAGVMPRKPTYIEEKLK